MCAALVSTFAPEGHAESKSRAEPAARAEPTPAQIKTARQLFSDAEQLRTEGKCTEAASKLRQAIAIKETPGLRFHLAFCEDQLGQLVQSNADYLRASELIRSGMAAPDVARLLEPTQKALAERIPTVQIRIPSGVSARTRLDDVELQPASLGGPLSLDPGKHTVLVEAEGYERFLLEFTLAEGQDRVVDATLRPVGSGSAAVLTRGSAAAPAKPVESSALSADTHSGFGAREIVVIGESALAVAGLGIGITYLAKHLSASNKVDDYYAAIDRSQGTCKGPRPSAIDAACTFLPDAVEEKSNTGNIALAGFIGAGVFGAAAVTTWFLWPSRSKGDTAVVVAPFPGGVVIKGSF